MNKLDPIYMQIKQFEESNSSVLSLKNLKLRSVPEGVEQYTHLIELDLSENELSKLPVNIGDLKNLQAIDISSNKFTDLPKEIYQFEQLKNINASYNHLRTIPKSLSTLTELQELYLYGNSLTNIDFDVLSKLKKLKVLHLGGNRINIADLQAGVSKLRRLEKLYLWNTHLDTFPEAILELERLKVLVITNNRIPSIPSGISKLTHLNSLLAGKNLLKDLPPEIGLLKSLWVLDLSKNMLKRLPPEIGNLTHLNRLFINANEIEELPSEIGNLQNLMWLFAGRREAERAKKGKKLIFVEDKDNKDSKGNCLTSLPKEITSLAKLKSIDLLGNDLPIPPELLKAGIPKSIFNYFFSRTDNKRRLDQAKILFVGQGSVGKTSLVQRILDNMFSTNETKTEGIVINRWLVDNQSEVENQQSKINLNIWDFGG